MNDFTVYPAIDLRKGRVVRLKQGKLGRATFYENSPAKTATQWINQGAKWLHVVNLDGAFGEDASENTDGLHQILRAADGRVQVQFGGGLRSLKDIEAALNLGVQRVVLGTLAHRSPETLVEALKEFGPYRVALALDSENDQIRIEGWTVEVKLSPLEFVKQFQADGLEIGIYTNILRDGLESGVDVEGSLKLAKSTGLKLIASGGVASPTDVRKVREAGLSGVIVGRALYENKFSLKEVLPS